MRHSRKKSPHCPKIAPATPNLEIGVAGGADTPQGSRGVGVPYTGPATPPVEIGCEV